MDFLLTKSPANRKEELTRGGLGQQEIKAMAFDCNRDKYVCQCHVNVRELEGHQKIKGIRM